MLLAILGVVLLLAVAFSLFVAWCWLCVRLGPGTGWILCWRFRWSLAAGLMRRRWSWRSF